MTILVGFHHNIFIMEKVLKANRQQEVLNKDYTNLIYSLLEVIKLK